MVFFQGVVCVETVFQATKKKYIKNDMVDVKCNKL